jgi:hypothetical protein
MAFVNISPETVEMTMQVGIVDTDANTFTPTSELQQYVIDRNCANNGVLITWLNSLGCWEYFYFYGRQTKGTRITSTKQSRKNTLQDWDANFSFGETDFFFYEVEGFAEVSIFSQMMEADLAETLSEIVESIQAQRFSGFEDEKLTILIDKRSFVNRDTDIDLQQISFSYIETSPKPIQRG